MNWKVLLFVVLLNSLLCLLQYLMGQIDSLRGRIAPRHSIIPGTRQKFLYWEDFYTQTYGDLLGLLWIMNTFAHLIISGKIDHLEWVIFVIVCVGSILVFLLSCLSPEHKPDWGYPLPGKISLGGLTHLPYFGALSGMAVISALNIVQGEIKGALFWATLMGALIYLFAFILDIKAGNFEPLKRL